MRQFPHKLSAVLAVLALLLVGGYAFRPDPPMRGLTQVYPPYQDFKGGKIVGSSVEIMTCALDAVGYPYDIKIVSGQGWADAQFRVKAGEADFFFGALHTQARDEYAVWSSALDLNKTYFIRRVDNPKDRRDPKTRWAVKKGSGISAQIEGQAMNITFIGDDNPDTARAIWHDLADYAYMDIDIWRWSLRENGIDDEILHMSQRAPDKVFQTERFHYEPVADQMYGAYFARHWLKSHPDFMERFNVAVGGCRQQRELK